MQLENLFPHKRNTHVIVNARRYYIGAGGFIANPDDGEPVDVPDEDAQKLLGGKGWQELSWDPADPENAGRFQTSSTATPKGAIGRPPRTMDQMRAERGQLKPLSSEEIGPQAVGTGTRDGSLTGVETKPPSDEDLAKAAGEDQDHDSEDVKNQQQLGGRERGAVDMSGEAAIGDGRQPTIVDPPIPVGDEEWPDPTTELSMDYLKKMADAYEVKYPKNIGKKKLVGRITKAMYPEDPEE